MIDTPETPPGLPPYAIGSGVDVAAVYGPEWNDTFIAGASWGGFDDNNYYTVEVYLLCDAFRVDRDRNSVERALEDVGVEYIRTVLSKGFENGYEESVTLSELTDQAPVELFMRHGLIPAYRPWVHFDVEIGDGDDDWVVATVEEFDEEEDDGDYDDEDD